MAAVVEQSSVVTTPDWGFIRYRVDGTDVTFVRDAKTQRGPMTLTEPYGEEAFALTFPKVSNWDVAAGTFSWLRTGATVEVRHHDADMAYVKTLGTFTITDLDVSGDGGQVTAICQGWLAARLAFRTHKVPPFARRNPVDIGIFLYRAIVPKSAMGNIRQRIGVRTRNRGSMDQSKLDYIDELLADAWDLSGPQWTLARIPEVPRRYELRRKDITTQHVTIPLLSGSGITWNLRTDVAATPNVVFGQWETPTGAKGRNIKFQNRADDAPPYNGPYSVGDVSSDVQIIAREMWSQGYRDADFDYRSNTFTDAMADAVKDVQRKCRLPRTGVVNRKTFNAIFAGYARNGSSRKGAYIGALASAEGVHAALYSSNGSFRGPNPNYDPRIWRVDTWVDYGSGITRKQAFDDAQRMVDRYRGPDKVWVGTVTLDGIDPPEMHRLDIREGMNARLLGIPGNPLAHITKVTQGPEDSPSVTLEVDTEARDHVSVARIKMRDRDGNQATKNRTRRADHGRSASRRTSKKVNDRYPVWDEESGAGDFRMSAKGGRWVVKRLLGGVVDAVVKADLETSPNRAFVAALFGQPVTKEWLDRWVGDPTSLVTVSGNEYRPFARPDARANREARGFIIAWGGPDQLAGYSPGEQSSGHPITGRLLDDGLWHCESQRVPYVWLAVWSVGGDTSLTGTIRVLDQP